MRDFDYKPPRVHSGELRTPVTFYEFAPSEGPEPGEAEKQTLFKAWAKISEVWMKDVELAKSNGTLSDVTLVIRTPGSDYRPKNKHYVSIDHPDYDKPYNIKHVQPDPQATGFMNIVAEVTS